MEGKKGSRNLNVLGINMLKALPHCLPPDVCKVRTKECVSNFDVIMHNQAVFLLVETYHTEEGTL
jgi:hypothetical protein